MHNLWVSFWGKFQATLEGNEQSTAVVYPRTAVINQNIYSAQDAETWK